MQSSNDWLQLQAKWHINMQIVDDFWFGMVLSLDNDPYT